MTLGIEISAVVSRNKFYKGSVVPAVRRGFWEHKSWPVLVLAIAACIAGQRGNAAGTMGTLALEIL